MKNSEKLTKMEVKTGITDCAKLVKSAQECVVGNETFVSLNMVNSDTGSDNVFHTVDMRDILSHVKPELLSLLKSVAAGTA